ncbi:MAG: hypothetical protein HOW73_04405 [Polyangiaceae bacterium]|nr:hypothetical protein [Polyangiaceae bacterium]
MPRPVRFARFLSIAPLLAGVLASSVAGADETPGERLFREGREALQRSELELACAKFKQSYDLEQALGPLLNLANCEENRGRLVAANELWKRAGTLTQPSSEERKLAEERSKALDVAIPKIRIKLAAGTPPETKVELDGVLVTLDDKPRPVDPGQHVVVARFGDKEDRKEVTAVRQGSYDVELRIEAPAGQPITKTPPTGEPSSGPSAGWIAGWIVGGVGVASLAGFAATGGIVLDMSSTWSDNGCDSGAPSGPCEKPSTGLYAANGVLLGVGLAGIGTGIILLVTQDAGGTDSKTALRPGPGDLGLSFEARF